MSIKSAQEFILRMQTDEDFIKKVTACKDSESRMAFVKASGYDCYRDEILQYKDELSDSLLDLISGGDGGDCGPILRCHADDSKDLY